MSHARFIVGDALEVLRTLPDDSADFVLTSPPFLALRSYLPADHPSKHLEMGSEPDPGAYIDSLMAVVVECRRVLAPHGSLCIELGDTYSGASGWQSAGDDTWSAGPDRMQATEWRSRPEKPAGQGWPLAKSLALVPQTLAFTLAYGRNPHTGQTYEPWRVRNIVRWVRPNPPVGGLGDKFRPATSEMIVACVSAKRYFDLDAVRSGEQSKPGGSTNWHPYDGRDSRGYAELGAQPNTGSHPAGAPPLDWWNIPAHPYKGAHYATWPPELCVKPIKAMCPERVCVTCGEPSRRIVDVSRLSEPDDSTRIAKAEDYRLNAHNHPPEIGWEMRHTTVGWSDCGHDTWRPGLVCDPFAGSGTTLAVATGHGRDAIGIDLDERNADLAEQRIGPMFLTIEHPDPVQ